MKKCPECRNYLPNGGGTIKSPDGVVRCFSCHYNFRNHISTNQVSHASEEKFDRDTGH